MAPFELFKISKKVFSADNISGAFTFRLASFARESDTVNNTLEPLSI